MRFCPFCNSLLPDEATQCLFCGRALSGSENLEKKTEKPRVTLRGFVRIPFKEKVRFQVLSLDPRGENLSLVAEARDISLSGIYFETERDRVSEIVHHFRMSNILWMEFKLPKIEKPIKLQGEIRRLVDTNKEKIGLGVMFLNVERKTRRLLDDFISEHL